MTFTNYLSFYITEIKHPYKLALLFGGFCLVVQMFWPSAALAQNFEMPTFLKTEEVIKRLPVASEREARYKIKVLVTAYSSTPDQTDSTPFITASNTTVRKGVVAANFLRFGTRVKIPTHFDNQIFVVEDRMNERFDERLDIWMESRAEAKAWGARWVTIEVL